VKAGSWVADAGDSYDRVADRYADLVRTGLEALPLEKRLEGSDVLRRAVAGYLARYKGLSRSHTESDLRVFLGWCTERGLEPLVAQRPHIELYIRWMQEVRRFKPSTVSRRISRRRLLPHLRHRRGAAHLAGRACPPTQRATRIADPRADPPAVRGDADRRP
jgi:hypothetical protein